MVDKAISNEVRHCVRADNVCFFITEFFWNFFLDIFMLDVALNEVNSVDWCHRKEIYCDNTFRAFCWIYFLGNHLRPSTRGSTNINHSHTFLEQLYFLVDFNKLEWSAASIAMQLCLLNILITHMPIHPLPLLLLELPVPCLILSQRRWHQSLRHHQWEDPDLTLHKMLTSLQHFLL